MWLAVQNSVEKRGVWLLASGDTLDSSKNALPGHFRFALGPDCRHGAGFGVPHPIQEPKVGAFQAFWARSRASKSIFARIRGPKPEE